MISKIKLILSGLLTALAFSFGWWVNGAIKDSEISSLKLEQSEYIRSVAEANAEVILNQKKANEDLMTRLSDLETKNYEDLKSAKENTDRLVSNYERGLERLRVRLSDKTSSSCSGSVQSDSSTSGVDDGEGTYGELHPTTSANLVAMTGQADQCSVKLTALQDWVLELIKNKGEKK